LASDRFNLTVLGLFAAIGLTLAAVGIYGVILYTAAQRTQEIGIRVAFGASKGQGLKLIIWEGMVLAGFCVGVGLAGALVLTRAMTNFLFGVGPTDPFTFVSVATFLVLISLLACYVPARRATRIDPMVALRWE